jgi:HAD superfamily hydrolase (TIGR01490 family)
MKRFAVFDIDGTLVRWQLYHAIASELAAQGFFTPTQHQSIDVARMQGKNRAHPESFRDYEENLVNVYKKAMLNLSVEQFNQAADTVFEEYKDQVYTYTRDLIHSLKQQDYLLFAISGSQSEIVAKIAKHYGFDDYVGTSFEQQAGRFTGAATVAREAKHLVLQQMAKKHGADYTDSVAVGDSMSDAPMLEAVERPIAFNPEKKLFDYAKERGWEVIVERKNMVYKLKNQDGKYILA